MHPDELVDHLVHDAVREVGEEPPDARRTDVYQVRPPRP
jgi:hypothetical protein